MASKARCILIVMLFILSLAVIASPAKAQWQPFVGLVIWEKPDCEYHTGPGFATIPFDAWAICVGIDGGNNGQQFTVDWIMRLSDTNENGGELHQMDMDAGLNATITLNMEGHWHRNADQTESGIMTGTAMHELAATYFAKVYQTITATLAGQNKSKTGVSTSEYVVVRP